VEPDVEFNDPDIVHEVGKKNGISNSVFHQALLEASHHDNDRDLCKLKSFIVVISCAWIEAGMVAM
jgi:hypothetical protein